MKLWEKKGFTGSEKFDERKYWAYGCHCFMLGDRPMTDDRPMPFGMPKDVLDAQVSLYFQIKALFLVKHSDLDLEINFNFYSVVFTSIVNAVCVRIEAILVSENSQSILGDGTTTGIL